MMSLGKLALMILLPFIVGLAGCTPSAEESAEEPTQSVAPAENIRLTIQDDSGDVTYEGVSGELPEGFPADFPIPAGVIEQSNRLLVGGLPMWSLVVQTPAAYAQTIAFYESQLPAAGWTVTGSREAEMDWGTNFFMQVRSADETIAGSVSIEDRESGAPVTVNLSRNP
jgi:hypothetical protein